MGAKVWRRDGSELSKGLRGRRRDGNMRRQEMESTAGERLRMVGRE